MRIEAKYRCIIPCEDPVVDWETDFREYEQARLHAALNAGYVIDVETCCIMCDYRMEDEE